MRFELPTVYDYQHEALWAEARYSVVEGSTKAGKTYPCLIWLLEQSLTHGQVNRAFWWAAPIYGQAEIAYRRMKLEMLAAPIRDGAVKANDTRLTISLPNGATIWFKSADSADNLYGEDVYGAVADEATRWGEDSWIALRTTLSATKAKVRIIGNVKGRKNWAYLMARKAENGEQDMHYARFTCWHALAAGIMDQAEIDDARRTLPPHAFRELYEAIPSEDGANPFDLRAIQANIAEPSTRPVVCWGVDVARSVDWTVAVGLDAFGHLCRFERWQKVPWSETVGKLAFIIGDTPSLVDSTGVGDAIVEALQNRCPNVEGFKFSSSSKQDLMEGLSLAIQTGEVKYPSGPIVNELEIFEFQHAAKGRVTYSAPIGMHDDCVMALALAVKHRNATTDNYTGIIARMF